MINEKKRKRSVETKRYSFLKWCEYYKGNFYGQKQI